MIEMDCDVCGREMRQWPAVEPRYELPSEPRSVSVWTCVWCHASTFRHVESGKIERVPYWPIDARWERAVSRSFGRDELHAQAFAHVTLCGIEAGDMAADDSLMWNPEAPAACRACRDAAIVIDARWPADLRGVDDREGR